MVVVSVGDDLRRFVSGGVRGGEQPAADAVTVDVLMHGQWTC